MIDFAKAPDSYGFSKGIMTDSVILAEHAFQLTAGKENRAASAVFGNDRLFVKMKTRARDFRKRSDATDA